MARGKPLTLANNFGPSCQLKVYAAQLKAVEPLEGGSKSLTFHADYYYSKDEKDELKRVDDSRDFKVVYTRPDHPLPFVEGIEYRICTDEFDKLIAINFHAKSFFGGSETTRKLNLCSNSLGPGRMKTCSSVMRYKIALPLLPGNS